MLTRAAVLLMMLAPSLWAAPGAILIALAKNPVKAHAPRQIPAASPKGRATPAPSTAASDEAAFNYFNMAASDGLRSPTKIRPSVRPLPGRPIPPPLLKP